MPDSSVPFALPRPGKAVGGMMIVVTVLWVALALMTNWASVGIGVVQFIAGSTPGVLRGEVWRLFTAPLMHDLQQPMHLVTTLLGLYFLAPTLESGWGPTRMVLFVLGSGALAFVFQVVGSVLVPSIGSDIWYGGIGVVTAIAVAWALQNRHAQVRLFFLIPVSAMAMIAFVFLLSVAHVIAKNNHTPEGLITPFGGMLAGYLFSDKSPFRRLYLKWRLKRLEADAEEIRKQTAEKAAAGRPHLRVIKGGAGKDDDDNDPKRYLN